MAGTLLRFEIERPGITPVVMTLRVDKVATFTVYDLVRTLCRRRALRHCTLSHACLDLIDEVPGHLTLAGADMIPVEDEGVAHRIALVARPHPMPTPRTFPLTSCLRPRANLKTKQ